MTIAPIRPMTITGYVSSARELHDAVKAIAGFASSDSTLPTLATILIEAESDRLILTATDRYTLGSYTLAWEGESFSAVLNTADVPSLLARLKSAYSYKARTENAISITWDESGFPGQLTFSEYGAPMLTVRCDVDPISFPAYRNLFPTNEPTAQPHVAFNPELFARFAKVPGRDKYGPMRMAFGNSATSPALVTIGDSFRGLIMPMRIAD